MSITADAEGKFTTSLGSMSSTVFTEDAESGRWVEITIGSGSPISPRTLLPHAAYSVVSTGVAAGGVSIGSAGIAISTVDTLDTLQGPVIGVKASLVGADLDMYDTAGFRRFHLGSSPAGVAMRLYGGDTAPEIGIVPDGRNGLDVLLPPNVIQAHEILDEPGLAMNRRLASQPLYTVAMREIVAVTIDVPTTGYVLVQAKSVVAMDGGAGFGSAWLQIDTLAGGTADDISFAAFGGDRSAVGTAFGSTSMQRIFLVNTGTHTFVLEGQMAPGSTAGIQTTAQASQISALFLPTSYGGMFTTVAISDEMRPAFEDSLSGRHGLPTMREQVFDLRALEERLRHAERQLDEAKQEIRSLREKKANM